MVVQLGPTIAWKHLEVRMECTSILLRHAISFHLSEERQDTIDCKYSSKHAFRALSFVNLPERDMKKQTVLYYAALIPSCSLPCFLRVTLGCAMGTIRGSTGPGHRGYPRVTRESSEGDRQSSGVRCPSAIGALWGAHRGCVGVISESRAAGHPCNLVSHNE